LDLSLNKYSTQFPALVKEVLLSESPDSRRCASISNGWCWLIAGNHIFVWRLVEGNRSSSTQAYHMMLQRTGLPFTQESVIIYSRGAAAPPGVVVVSGEGTLRRWTPLGESHVDTVIDIASEVVLSIQLEGNYFEGMAYVLLTTTSGSLYRVDLIEKERELRYSNIGSIVNRGLKSRISSMLWGASTQANIANSRILRISVMNRPSDDMEAMDEEDEEASTVFMAISTTTITLYSAYERSLLWTVPIQQLTAALLPSKMRAANIRASEPLQVWCLDVVPLRQGALFLFGVATAIGGVEMGLAYLDLRNNIETSPASFNSIFMLLNRPTLGLFRALDESSFVGRVHLLMSGSTMRSPSMTHTDGVSILHHKCLQTVFLPESFYEKSALRFHRTIELPLNDTVLGYACCDDFSFIIRAKAGIESIRVLPVGFDQESEETVKELEEALDERDGDPMFVAMFKKSFLHFVGKRIGKASAALNALLHTDTNVDLPAILIPFLKDITDSTCSSSGIGADLRNKKLIFQRVILYLKNMQVHDQVMESERPCIPPFKNVEELRLMSSQMQEFGERLDVAFTISSCVHKMEVRLLDEAAEHATNRFGVNEGGFQNVFLAKISSVHLLFPSLLLSLRSHLSHHKHEHRLDALSAAARVMMAMSHAIEKNRASRSSISVPPTAAQWTHGVIAQSYLDMAECILSELEKEGSSLAETTKGRLREWLTGAICFGLSEQRGRTDNNKLLRRIYDMGEASLALDMAEKFKDFRLLMVITKSMEDDERRGLLDGYKRRFKDDNFELYMCNYYLKNKMMDSLLEQRGERVEAFMSEHDAIRWRRELQTEKYEKAANSLMTAAMQEQTALWDQKMYASLAFLSACCADENADSVRMEKVKRTADETLTLIGHQERVPLESITVMYPEQRQRARPLTLDELMEVNLFECDDPNDYVDGLFRALVMLGDLANRDKSGKIVEELRERINEVWKRTFDNRFYQIQSSDEANRTLFVALLNRLIENVDLSSPSKLSLLPSSSLLRSSASDLCKTSVQQRVEMAKLTLVD
ncbi:hypothetical protein PFISCL1PPCAC_25095, partial [Pristionchus fissidentatus]